MLINRISLFIILPPIVFSLLCKDVSDKILLIWLGLGSLCSLSFINFFQPRYFIIVLIPLLILMGRFLTNLFDYVGRRTSLWHWLLTFATPLLILGLFFIEIFQLVNYYIVAPVDLEECRRNSYGCKETAEFLSRVPDIEDYTIIPDVRMTVFTCLKYFSKHKVLDSKKEDRVKKGVYYIVWAPESHPEDYWDGLFRNLYASFKQRYPKGIPIKTIYYPGGLPAIHIFRVEEDVER